MASSNTPLNINRLRDQLQAIEPHYASSSLVIYTPREEHEPFFRDLCQTYLDASPRERYTIRDALADKKGILNCLLGYVYQSAERIRATGDKQWLRIGLAAAALQGSANENDFRDFLLALADLYVSAEEMGLDPKTEFAATGGDIPANFDTYAVVRSRRERPK